MQAQQTITAAPEHGVGEQEMTIRMAANAIWNKLNVSMALVREEGQLMSLLSEARALADSIVHHPGAVSQEVDLPSSDERALFGVWWPIETAPRSSEKRIMIARISDGKICDIDFDAVLEEEYESWEMPQTYWIWKSAFGRVEEPTHWALLPVLQDGRDLPQLASNPCNHENTDLETSFLF